MYVKFAQILILKVVYNDDEAVELQALEGESDGNSDTSIVGEWSVRYIKN